MVNGTFLKQENIDIYLDNVNINTSAGPALKIADNVKAKLSDWNSTINKRIDKAQTQLKDALKKYYNIEAK